MVINLVQLIKLILKPTLTFCPPKFRIKQTKCQCIPAVVIMYVLISNNVYDCSTSEIYFTMQIRHHSSFSIILIEFDEFNEFEIW